MDYRFELLKVEYESVRAWLFSLLALIMVMAIGGFTVPEGNFKNILIIDTKILIVPLVILFILQTYRYLKLKTYLKAKK